MATTVAGDDPDTAANRAQAMTPASAQAAMPMANHGRGEIDHAFGNAAMGEKISGQDEERNGHDLELFNAGEEFQGHRFNWNFA